MNDSIGAVGRGGKRMSRLGIATMILGFLVMLAPILVGFSLLWILGLLVSAAGLVRMFWAFQTGSLGKGVLVFGIGGLTLLGGIALLANPMLASGVLTIVPTSWWSCWAVGFLALMQRG